MRENQLQICLSKNKKAVSPLSALGFLVLCDSDSQAGSLRCCTLLSGHGRACDNSRQGSGAAVGKRLTVRSWMVSFLLGCRGYIDLICFVLVKELVRDDSAEGFLRFP